MADRHLYYDHLDYFIAHSPEDAEHLWRDRQVPGAEGDQILEGVLRVPFFQIPDDTMVEVLSLPEGFVTNVILELSSGGRLWLDASDIPVFKMKAGELADAFSRGHFGDFMKIHTDERFEHHG